MDATSSGGSGGGGGGTKRTTHQKGRVTRGSPTPATPTAELDPNVQTILTVLRTYPSNEVAIVGCHAARMSRKSCEYDLIVVSKDPTPPKYVKAGEFYAKVIFRSEADLRIPDPEFGTSLAKATILRDNSLLLASAVATCKRRFGENCAKAAESHLAAALKALGRVDEKAEENLPEADFWLASAAYDLGVSEIFSSLQVPSPSHTFAQMKALSKRTRCHLQGVDGGIRVQARLPVLLREPLETLGVLYDVLRTTSMDM